MKLIATPFSLSGVNVGTARNSLTLSPRNPGNVVQPNWYIIGSAFVCVAFHSLDLQKLTPLIKIGASEPCGKLSSMTSLTPSGHTFENQRVPLRSQITVSTTQTSSILSSAG